MDEQMEIDLANLLNDPAFEELKLRLVPKRKAPHLRAGLVGWVANGI